MFDGKLVICADNGAFQEAPNVLNVVCVDIATYPLFKGMVTVSCRVSSSQNSLHNGSRNNASAPFPLGRFISTNEPPCASAI